MIVMSLCFITMYDTFGFHITYAYHFNKGKNEHVWTNIWKDIGKKFLANFFRTPAIFIKIVIKPLVN